MKKLLLIFILFIGSCAVPRRVEFVNSKFRNIYLSSVSIVDGKGTVYGSGTIIYSKANQRIFVLTAAHVVNSFEKKVKISISTAFDVNNRTMKILKIDDKSDLAILYSIEKEKIARPYVKISNNIPKIGDDVWVISAPAGRERTLTSGIISNFQIHNGILLYRATADLYYGSSGGGMFNAKRELIGVADIILEVDKNKFSSQLIPGGFLFIRLEEIRNFLNENS